jgi:hypothetical protein
MAAFRFAPRNFCARELPLNFPSRTNGGNESETFMKTKMILILTVAALSPPIYLRADEMNMQTNSMSGMDMKDMKGMDKGNSMYGMYGHYSMDREASGTAWQPEATPMGGMMFMPHNWMLMFHGYVDGVYDYQGGNRGGTKFFSPNMFMGMAQHPVGIGTFGFRTMLSLEPATIGTSGYPELLQTGETANGKTPLVDRQHPHDLLMELAATYSIPINDNNSVFAYFGYPGEPALGPPTFMHRFSGEDIPEAPITHHWLDSTHVTFGVATLGYVWKQFKVDGSIFTGREPDQYRWNFDPPRFDSYSARLTYNPTANWSMQVSYGNIHSPEQLEPNVNQQRVTASVSYQRHWNEINWGTTLAFGENFNSPGNNLYAVLLESTVVFHDTHTIFARAENVEKDELFISPDPRAGQIYNVGKVSAGYIYDFPRWHHFKFGVGGLGSAYILPASLTSTYGQTPLSFMLFVRVKL